MDERKDSLAGVVHATSMGLSNTFACNEKSPEDLIFSMFKIPNKNEASIGKLLMVSGLNNYTISTTFILLGSTIT